MASNILLAAVSIHSFAFVGGRYETRPSETIAKQGAGHSYQRHGERTGERARR